LRGRDGNEAQGHFLLCSERVFGGCREAEFYGKISRSHKRRSHTFSSHRFYYNFTEITITTPPLTRILDRLIGRGISLCGDCI
jgi:hypothetical protein